MLVADEVLVPSPRAASVVESVGVLKVDAQASDGSTVDVSTLPNRSPLTIAI